MRQTLLFLCLLPLLTNAQIALELHPDPFEGAFQVDLSDHWAEPIAHAQVINKSDQAVSLRWVFEVQSAPAEWEYRVCDKNQCYSTGVVSNVNLDTGAPNKPVDLAPGDSSLLDLHVLPRGVAGEGTFHIYLASMDAPTEYIDTAFYTVSVSGLTSTVEQQVPRIKVWPNPAADWFTLTENMAVEHIYVYNLLGREMANFSYGHGRRYDIGTLPSGMYFVALTGKKGEVLRTIRLTKRADRP